MPAWSWTACRTVVRRRSRAGWRVSVYSSVLDPAKKMGKPEADERCGRAAAEERTDGSRRRWVDDVDQVIDE